MKVKKEKAPKPDKPEKGAKGAKPQQKYFWTAFFEKRKAKKNPGYVREPAIAKQPTSKEDKVKLLAALVMVLLVPIVFILLSRHNAAKADDADKGASKAAGTENAAMKAAGGDG